MNILVLLASTQGIKGKNPNIALAKEISDTNNKAALKELIDNLGNKDPNIQSDCIKTLYETGYLKPELIADYFPEFIKLLTAKNNRLIWGGMIALAIITDLKHREVYSALDKIMEAVQKGSVITIDNGIEILSKLNKHSEYFDTTDPLLIEQLWKCPIKQLPMYTEKARVSIIKKNKEVYKELIEKRMVECDKDSQLKRLMNTLKQLQAI